MAELISTMAQVPLTNGCTVTWEAIDPSTGAAITGVVIENATLYGYRLDRLGTETKLEVVEPLWLRLPQDDAP